MRMTITKKLGLSFGLLIFFLTVSGLSSYRLIQRIRKDLSHVVEVDEPLEEAALEMEINVVETAWAILHYLKDLEPKDLEKIQDSVADFEKFSAKFKELAETDQEKLLDQELSKQYGELKQFGNEIIALADQKQAALLLFREGVKEIDELIDEKLQAAIDRSAPDAEKKLEAALEMEINIDEAFDGIEDYLIDPHPALRPEILDAQEDFKRFEAMYRKAGTSADEKDYLNRIGHNFEEAVKVGLNMMVITDNIHEKLAQVKGYLQNIDMILDDQIQPLIHGKLIKAEERAKISAARAAILLLVLWTIAVIIGCASAWAISRGVINPVSELIKGAKTIGSGMLEHRIEIKTKDEFGQLAAAFNRMVEDINSSREALLKSEERYRSVVNSIPIGVSLISLGMKVLAVNSEIKKWFPDIDSSRKPFCYEMLAGPPRKDICHDCPVCKTFKDGRVHKSIMKKRIGAENRIYSVVSAPIKNKAGKITAAAELVEDITERRRAQQALQEHSVRLEKKVEERTKQLKKAQEALVRKEKLAVIGQLAGGVGHELRNPLGVIKNATYFLNMKVDTIKDEAVKDNIAIIRREINIADRIITDLLDFARVKSPVRRETDLNQLVRETLSRSLIPENITVNTYLAQKLAPVFIDPVQVGQIFLNLIENAIQAVEKGGALNINTRAAKGALEAAFVDEGCSIPEGDLKKIFEPLFTTKAKGIGLGLAICKSLAEVNGGTILVESRVGVGSKFTVRFTEKGSGHGKAG